MASRAKQTKEKTKQEIAEKVKEIKLRQQNWLRQRSDSLSKSSSCDDVFNNPSKASNNTKTVQPKVYASGASSAKQQVKQHVLTQTNQKNSKKNSVEKQAKNQPQNSKFKYWLKTRTPDLSNSGSDHEEIKSDGLPSKRMAEEIDGNQKIERPKTYNVAKPISALSRGTDNEHWGGDYLKEYSAQPLPPEMFDSLADKIVNRVKSELKMKDGAPSSSGRSTTSSHGFTANGLENHYCQKCSELMEPPIHSPMLIIPCGHTACNECSKKQQNCPLCHSTISSLTCNIMLQQIIVDYKKKHRSGKTSRRKASYTAGNYTEDADYHEEYQSLSLRFHVLETEAVTQETALSSINEHIENHRRTIKNIVKEEIKAKSEIQKLEEKLKVLKKHKEEYSHKCEELENEHYEEANKLALLQESMQGLQKEMEKVKLLSENSNSYY